MLDNFKREITYLRISITDRCNLRCVYCMPEKGIDLIKHDEILSFEEIVEFTKVAVSEGINKVRITGGEPLVRKGVVNLIKELSRIKGINDLSMTTNGIFLSDYAAKLKEAGLNRVNISLDTTDEEIYKKITRGGDINKVFDGIKKAKEVGLNPVKINCVIKKSTEELNAVEVAEWCKKNDLIVRFIDQMDIEKGEFSIVHGGDGGNCGLCNRLRLTANGYLKPCLFSDLAINIRENDYRIALHKAVGLKPEAGTSGSHNKFYNIGG